MAEPEPRDDPEYMKNFPNGFLDFDVSDTCFEEDRDLNLEEEPTKINPEIFVDVFARKPQVKDSASCSANEKTYASSSRNREDSSESGEIRRVDNKEDDRNDGDVPKESDDKIEFSDHREEAENREKQSHEETCSLITQPSNQNPRLNQIATSSHTMDPQQQLTRTNPGSTSSTSDRNNISQPIGMQSQLSPNAASFRPLNNTYQQLPGANQMANLVPTQTVMPTPTHIYIPWPMQGPMINPYHHSMASQQNFYQLPVPNQIRGPALVYYNYEPWRLQNTYHQHPSANQMTNPMPGPMRPIQHPMAYPQNLYQHPMADPRMPQYRNATRGQPRSFDIGQNPRHARPALNQQMPQRVPQTQQPTQSQGSSEQGQDQQQPK